MGNYFRQYDSHISDYWHTVNAACRLEIIQSESFLMASRKVRRTKPDQTNCNFIPLINDAKRIVDHVNVLNALSNELNSLVIKYNLIWSVSDHRYYNDAMDAREFTWWSINNGCQPYSLGDITRQVVDYLDSCIYVGMIDVADIIIDASNEHVRSHLTNYLSEGNGIRALRWKNLYKLIDEKLSSGPFSVTPFIDEVADHMHGMPAQDIKYYINDIAERGAISIQRQGKGAGNVISGTVDTDFVFSRIRQCQYIGHKFANTAHHFYS